MSTEGALSSQRRLDERDLAYDRISDCWSSCLDEFDTRRRIEVLIHDFLGRERVTGKTCLDAGCGLGHFSSALWQMTPSRLVAIDIAPMLVSRLKALLPGVDCREGDLLNLKEALGAETFDVVVSSEVIEHTPDPERAVKELAMRCHVGGLIAISCPNRRWLWLLKLARLFGLRKVYRGYENWVKPADLIAWLTGSSCEILRAEGIHTIPWHFLPRSLLCRVDSRFRKENYGIALNLAVLARKTA